MKIFLKVELIYFFLVALYLFAIILNIEKFLTIQGLLSVGIVISSLFFLRTISLRLTEELNAYKLKIRSEIENKDTFVATIIHDLKNPLLAQSRLFENLIKKYKKEHNPDLYIMTQMLSSCRWLFEMVSSILVTYKYADAEIRYSFEKIDITEIIKSVCDELTYLTGEENYLVLNFKVANQVVVADKLHLRRVISNLISNALHYRKDDSYVNVEVSTNKNKVVLKVINQGYYIKPNKREELFEKYISNSSKFNSFGTGLGLYISKKIITAHKGSMICESTPDGINTFGFYLPLINFKNFSNNRAIEDDIIEV